jgi:hypothetical protein
VWLADRQYQCYDRLHPKYDDRFDIWMPSKHEALEFGARTLQVVVVPDVPAPVSATNRVDRGDRQAELAAVHVDPLRVAVECPALYGDDVPLLELAARSAPRAPLTFTAADAIVDRRAIL